MYGSTVQKQACKNVGIPQEHEEDFWDEVGRRTVESCIRRKRATVYNAMKKKFVDYCKKPEVKADGRFVPPPNPVVFVPERMLTGELAYVGGCGC
jgi:hypothetical protein